MSDPFEAIQNMYDEQVQKADQKGFAEHFTESAQLFFKSVNEHWLLRKNNVTFHFDDVEYLDGYFIFGYGTNSVVHFHVRECPGWKFGIWWHEPKDATDDRPAISGEFFAQNEETIDKFKPSASMIEQNVTADLKYQSCDVYGAVESLWFIHAEPELAFCRDYKMWDYNTEYHSREEARAEYLKYRARRELEDKLTAEFDSKVLDFVREKVLPLYTDASLVDCSENRYPRYELVAPYESNQDMVDQPGYYSLEDDIDHGIVSEFYQIVDDCDAKAYEHNMFWVKPLYLAVNFLPQHQIHDSE